MDRETKECIKKHLLIPTAFGLTGTGIVAVSGVFGSVAVIAPVLPVLAGGAILAGIIGSFQDENQYK
jgi:hypothetical protein